MDFVFTEEQEALRAAARRFLTDQFPLDRVVALSDSDTGWDPDSWKELSTLGWLDSGLGTMEHAVLAEESGYALYPGPLWTTLALAQPAFAGHLDREGPATLAWRDDGVLGLAGVHAASCLAEHVDGRWLLSGVKHGVPDATAARDAAVVARGPAGTALWRLDLTAHPDTVRNVSMMDRSRRTAELWLDRTPVEPLVPASAAPRVLFQIRRTALALLACEAVGVTHRALDVATVHVNSHTPVDSPGAYRGVSHRIANVYTALQLARALAYRAAWAVTTGDTGVDTACVTATASSGHAAVFACENAMAAVGSTAPEIQRRLRLLHRRARWINAFEGFPGSRRSEPAGWAGWAGWAKP
ncbi:MAG TPA: acyl-CoA dehydrogenase family protein [Mycobacteriales bacterium]|nr:acyl-CoA dehydrogenase family protein [Mycobacteriales bacterium]